MNLIEFNLRVRQYGGIADVKAKFPENLRWITNLNDKDKFSNYLSIMSKDEYDEYSNLINDVLPFKCFPYELLDKIILIYEGIHFHNDLPLMKTITEDELSTRINLDDYCIINMDKNYNIYELIKLTDISSCIGYSKYKSIVLRDLFHDFDKYELSEGFIEISSILLSFSDRNIIKIVKGDVAKKFWNAGLRKVIDEFNPDLSIPIDNINWKSGITAKDFNDLDLVIEKLKKFDEQFNN